MPHYNAVLFDFDGTIIDSMEGISKSVVYALNSFGIREDDQNNLRRFIGPPLWDSFRNYYGFDNVQANKAVEKYRERYSEYGWKEFKLYDGIDNLLKELKQNDIKLGIASAKPHTFVTKILEYAGILKCFDTIAGAELDGKRSEKPDLIRYALKSLGIYNKEMNMHNIVMVGDRIYDYNGAKEIGIDFIGVLYGFGSKAEFENAKTADTVEELKKQLI